MHADYMYACVWSYLFWYTSTSMYMHVEIRGWHGMFSSIALHHICLGRVSRLSSELTDFISLAAKPSRSRIPHICLLVPGVTANLFYLPSISMNAKKPNYILQTWAARTLSSETSPKSQRYLSKAVFCKNEEVIWGECSFRNSVSQLLWVPGGD